MHITDIELTVPGGKGHINIITKRAWRVKDGLPHPVTIIKPKECNDKGGTDQIPPLLLGV